MKKFKLVTTLKRKSSLLFLLASMMTTLLTAQIYLPVVIGDSMVLQRGKYVKIWGRTTPAQTVKVSFSNQVKSTISNADSTFSVLLDPMLANANPQILTIECNMDKVQKVDVLVGDVFLCSGQSNMAFKVPQLTAADQALVAADSNYPNIRYYEVAKTAQSGILGNDTILDVPWARVNDSISRRMSAIAFYYSRQLYHLKNVPIGIIDCSRGSSCADAWISNEYIQQHPELAPSLFPITTGATKFFLNPGSLYSAMLNRVLPYTLSAFLWYQGEANAAKYYNYKKVFSAVIDCFRKTWNDDQLPFVFAQLAAFNAAAQWSYIREVQDSVGSSLPRVAMISTIDVGTANDIHPKNKQTVGDRFCLAIRQKLYGENVEYTGPTFQSVRYEGNKAIITFSHATGLKTKSNILNGLEICGLNHVYLPATNAEIVNNELTVWNTAISNPLSVRYGWSNFPLANLYNEFDLPANPFRTSDLAPSTVFISTLKGNDNNNGTVSAPFKTLDKALSTLVYFKKTTINLAPDETFNESGIQVPINTKVEIIGKNTTIIAASQRKTATERIMYQSANSELTLKGLVFKNGYAVTGTTAQLKSGGAIYAEGLSLDIDSCRFFDNIGGGNGGAISNYGKSMKINHCFFEKNVALTGSGGAILQMGVGSKTDNSLLINATTFSNDSAYNKGAAMYIQSNGVGASANIDIINNLFFENYVTVNGQAALHFDGTESSKSYIINNTFYKNREAAVRIDGTKHEVYLANNVMVAGSYGYVSNKTTSARKAVVAQNNIICGSISAINTNIDEVCLNAQKTNFNNTVNSTATYPLTKVALSTSTTNTFIPYLPIISESSTLVDAGVNELLGNGINKIPQYDMRGILRSKNDIGAYEFDKQTDIEQLTGAIQKLAVFPNPAADILNLPNDIDAEKVEILDLTGSLIYSTPFQKMLSISFLKSGIYFIKVSNQIAKFQKL